jgi:hypothetical protein
VAGLRQHCGEGEAVDNRRLDEDYLPLSSGVNCLVGAMFQMMELFAEFERAAVLAGLARAKEQGINLGLRRLEDCDPVRAIKTALAANRGGGGRTLKLVRGVLRIENELAA